MYLGENSLDNWISVICRALLRHISRTQANQWKRCISLTIPSAVGPRHHCSRSQKLPCVFRPHKKNPAWSFNFFVCAVVSFWFENVLVRSCNSLASRLPFVPIYSDMSEMGIFHQFLFGHTCHQTHMNLPELWWQKEQNGPGGLWLQKKTLIFSAVKPEGSWRSKHTLLISAQTYRFHRLNLSPGGHLQPLFEVD